MIEALLRKFEWIRLPVDELLWQKVSSFLKEEGASVAEKSRILLIGTDINISLARAIWSTYPEAIVTVAEKDEKVVASAKKSLSKEEESKINFVQGDFLEKEFGDYAPFDMVIAKHLLHFFSAEEVKRIVTKALGLGSILFASAPKTPYIGSGSLERTLRQNHISSKSRDLDSAGKVFIFKRGE